MRIETPSPALLHHSPVAIFAGFGTFGAPEPAPPAGALPHKTCQPGLMKELVYQRTFLSAAERYSDRTAIIDGDHHVSYGEHANRTLRLTRALHERLDVGRADRFAVMALNSHEYFALYHAAFLGGGIINPLNLRLAGKELDYIIRDSGTEVIFADAFFAGAIRAALDASDEPNNVRKVVLIGEGDVPHDLTFDDLVDGVDAAAPHEPEEDDPVVLMYTRSEEHTSELQSH